MGCISGLLSIGLFLWIGCHVPVWAFGIVVVVGVIYLCLRLAEESMKR